MNCENKPREYGSWITTRMLRLCNETGLKKKKKNRLISKTSNNHILK